MELLLTRAVPWNDNWGGVYIHIFMFTYHKDNRHFSATKEIRNLKHEYMNIQPPPNYPSRDGPAIGLLIPNIATRLVPYFTVPNARQLLLLKLFPIFAIVLDD